MGAQSEPLTGEFDREGWHGRGTPRHAFNQTETRFAIIGTDLGVSFTHHDRMYFLFGDTWRVGHSIPNDDLDAIAYSPDKNANGGIKLTFLPRPPLVPGISQAAFEVPLDGVSWDGNMYAFFSTNHRQVGKYAQMGSSIVARSNNDGLDFRLLYGVSRYKFINVSTTIVDPREHGLPGEGPQLVGLLVVLPLEDLGAVGGGVVVDVHPATAVEVDDPLEQRDRVGVVGVDRLADRALGGVERGGTRGRRGRRARRGRRRGERAGEQRSREQRAGVREG